MRFHLVSKQFSKATQKLRSNSQRERRLNFTDLQIQFQRLEDIYLFCSSFKRCAIFSNFPKMSFNEFSNLIKGTWVLSQKGEVMYLQPWVSIYETFLLGHFHTYARINLVNYCNSSILVYIILNDIFNSQFFFAILTSEAFFLGGGFFLCTSCVPQSLN